MIIILWVSPHFFIQFQQDLSLHLTGPGVTEQPGMSLFHLLGFEGNNTMFLQQFEEMN